MSKTEKDKADKNRKPAATGIRIIGISSGKGGVGKTTVTSNLALALKSFGMRVTIVDCNISTPHLSYYLGVDSYDKTLNDVLLGKSDARDAIYNYDGIRYVPASLELKDLLGLDLTKFKNTIRRFAEPGKTDFILLDSAPGLGKEAISVMHAADEIIFVTTPFVSSVNDVIRCSEVLKEFGNKKVSIVLNMATGKKHELLPSTVEEVTGLPVLGTIPFDASVVHSLAFGSPVLSYRPDSRASTKFMQLAANLAGADYKPPSRFDDVFTRIRSLVYNTGLQVQQGKAAAEEFIKRRQ